MHITPERARHFLKRDLGLLYSSQILWEIARTFFKVFLPIFVFNEVGIALSVILLAYSVEHIIYSFTLYYAFNWVSKLGAKKFLILGTLLTIPMFATLYLADIGSAWWLIGFLVLMGVSEFFYFTGLRVDEVYFTDKGKRGREMGIIRIAMLGMAALAPYLGGAIIDSIGFGWLFLVAVIITATSAVPLLYTTDEHPKGATFTWREVIQFIKKHRLVRPIIALAVEGVRNANLLVLWPIFLYILIPNYTKVGWINTIIIVITMAVTWYAGTLIDKHGEKKVLNAGTSTGFFSWVGKGVLYFIATINPFHVIAVGALDRFSQVLLLLPVKTEILDRSDGKDILIFGFIQKWARNVGRALVMLLIALIAVLLNDPALTIVISFGIMAFLVFLVPWVMQGRK